MSPDRSVTETTLATHKAGTLLVGDEFLYQEAGAGGGYSTFTFYGHVLTDAGYEHVSCFGGSSDPNGHREWRAFSVDSVVATARPTSKVRKALRGRQ